MADETEAAQPQTTNELLAPPRWTGDVEIDQVSIQNYLNDLYRQLQAEGASGSATGTLPRGWIDGFVLGNNADNPVRGLDVGPGAARADDDGGDIRSSSLLTKRLQGPFAAGDGEVMLDTAGQPAASTWYHIFAIGNPSSGAADVLASTSIDEPTMPEGFSKKRRVGSIKTDSTGAITLFLQFGDEFRWFDPPLDVNVATVGVTGVLTTLASVPPDVNVKAILNVFITDAAQLNSLYLSPPDVRDELPSTTAAPLVSARRQSAVTADWIAEFAIWTNTAQQIRRRADTASIDTLAIATLGWIDPRGRDAG